jgi:uncharacterized protein YecT (DUF1311 family)
LNDICGRLKSGYAKYAQPRVVLIAAQRVWVTFRDAECGQDQAAVDGGSVAPQIFLNCKTRLTNARVIQLQDRLLCREGKLSCVTLGDAAD